MFAPAKATACKACARAKRKCDKQQPACHRCRERQIACVYPPAKLSSYVALEPLPLLPPALPTIGRTLVHSTESSGMSFDGLFPDCITNGVPLPAVPNLAALGSNMPSSAIDSLSWLLEPSERLELVESLESPALWLPSPSAPALLWPLGWPPQSSLWFLAPATWEIDHRVPLHVSSDDVGFLRVQISGIRMWLRTWVATGGCPFIHPCLYGAAPAMDDRPKMPSCVQVAFMAMSSYMNRTDATTGLVLDAIDAQASQLLLQETVGAGANTPSLLDQLARVHALVVYQVIGLFDGNVRARHLADVRRTTLSRWSRQLLENMHQGAGGDVCTPFRNDGSTDVPAAELGLVSAPDTERTWHVWILAESIRRIWVVTSVIEAIYHTLKHGWSPMTGSLPCTARHGLWQARSAAEWAACCAETATTICTPPGPAHNPGWICDLYDLERFIDGADAADVDVLSRALMSSAYGRERVRQWERDSRSSRLASNHEQ